MNQKKKPEPKEVINARSRKHRANKTTGKVEIVGLKPDEIQEFHNLPGLENLTHAEKLRELILCWKQSFLQTTLPLHGNSDKLTVKVNPDKVSKPKIDDWYIFEKEFFNFLGDFKDSNRLRSGLRKEGKYIKAELDSNEEYSKAFKYICERLINSLKEPFKKMFLQGYFYLSKTDIIEIAQEKERESLLLLLYNSLKLSNLEEPVKEAKKRLGFKI